MVLDINKSPENADNYDDLLVSVEASQNQLNLLIAVCDNSEFRDKIIEQYEQDLRADIPRYRIKLSPENSSLSFSINQLIKDNPQLETCENAVITVTGVEEFRFLPQEKDKQQSPQNELLGYFQWTREAFMHFPYSIIVWMNSYFQQQLKEKSPDFWSWRKGVFRFSYPATNIVNIANLKPNLISLNTDINQKSSSLLSLEDLQELIAKI